ncbi:MAG: DUF1385 domain-containing protein, partial [Clostridiales bacterium]|nr:DUF1385 domain-containing protein [Clostridiales bacterium]
MKKKTNRTYIGGQAVIQGVMMRGKRGMAMTVRDDNGEMQLEAKRITPPEKRSKATKIPFVRGVVNFVVSLVCGMKALLRSSEAVVGDDEEDETKFSQWVEQKLKISAGDIISVAATVLGVLLAVGLFVFLPNYLTELIAEHFSVIGGHGSIYYNLIEGGFRLVIFILYILFTLCFKSLRETYRYHGAEHKTINCYEYGMPLTVENVKKCSRLHDRCGTTFIFIVLVISIVLFSLVSWLWVGLGGITTNIAWLDRIILICLKILCLPVVAGISYELLKLFSLTDFPLFFPLKAPGYLLQLLTTREPSDDMIECAIAAFEKTLEMDENPASPEKTFATETKLSKLMAMMKKSFAEKNIDDSDAEWILSLTLKVPRSELNKERVGKKQECKKILEIFEERLTGRPLWY